MISALNKLLQIPRNVYQEGNGILLTQCDKLIRILEELFSIKMNMAVYFLLMHDSHSHNSKTIFQVG